MANVPNTIEQVLCTLPFSEEFVLAQSQALNGVSGDQIEALIAAQKEIIAATWSVERRAASGAGKSAADITAIAAAQAELKARVDQMASSGRRGQRASPYPQQIAPPRQGRGGQRLPRCSVDLRAPGGGAGRSDG